MFCKSCGNQIDNDSAYCSFCGAKQSDTNKPQLNVTSTLNQPQQQDIAKTNSPSEGIKLTKVTPNTSRNSQIEKDNARVEKEAFYFGIILMLVWALILYAISRRAIDLDNSRKGLLIITTIIRIIAVLWISGIASRLDRDKFFWAIFAFLFPGPALIIIGTLTTKRK